MRSQVFQVVGLRLNYTFVLYQTLMLDKHSVQKQMYLKGKVL